MQTNNGSGQEPFAPKTIPAAIEGLDAAIDGRIAQAGAVTAAQLTAHTDRQDNPHGVTAAQVGAVTPTQLDAAIQGTRMVQLWGGSWASGSITLSDTTANYRLLILGSNAGMMVIPAAGSVHGSTRNLWGNNNAWHVVDNIYYIVITGNQLTIAHSQKMLNSTYISAADAIAVVYGIR